MRPSNKISPFYALMVNQGSSSWACGPPIKHEKVSGAGVPARQPVCTGWKACATGRTFQDRNKVIYRLTYLKLTLPFYAVLPCPERRKPPGQPGRQMPVKNPGHCCGPGFGIVEVVVVNCGISGQFPGQ